MRVPHGEEFSGVAEQTILIFIKLTPHTHRVDAWLRKIPVKKSQMKVNTNNISNKRR